MPLSIQNIYPSNEATGVPTGINILITFSNEIDEERAKKNIMVYGPDFDVTSGPDSTQWIDVEKGYNPYFLQSPGFKGDLQYDMYFELLNSDNTVFSGLDYHTGSPNYKTRVKIVPKKPLAPSTTYTVYIIGDPDADDDTLRGISSRTVYSTQFGANTGDGNASFRGGYTGSIEDQIVVEITDAGNIGTAEYEWYYASAPTLTYTGITSRKYRSLVDTGIDVRFTGNNFKVGDKFTINVYPPTYMASSYKYTFTTGTGSIEAIPSTTSTSVLGDVGSVSVSDEFEVDSTTPKHKSVKESPNLRIIKLEFSADVDPSTINDKTIKIEAHPATGYDPTVTDIGRLNKFILVDGNVVYILLQKGEGT